MGRYQAFPGDPGSSKSSEKLVSLRLPKLSGKSLLDIGCNDGFFCGYAIFDGASRVVGLDRSKAAISYAKQRFPEAEFLNQTWDVLPEGPFDTILLLSAIHYAEDQAAMIHRLVNLLSDDGVLVLEMGMVTSHKAEWVEVKRSIDRRYFPTFPMLEQVLKNFAWKRVGLSVKQKGDPLDRYVIHIRKRKPYAFLFMQKSGSGKSSICNNMFGNQTEASIVRGDFFYKKIKEGMIDVSPSMKVIVDELKPKKLNIVEITRKIFKAGLVNEVVKIWMEKEKGADIVLDSFVPHEYRSEVVGVFKSLGYFTIVANWDESISMESLGLSRQKSLAYEEHLLKGNNSKEI
jgi:ubiquinone/menaquinone biosynthesis C-methylase UbiE